MKKTLIALTLATLAGSAAAQTPDTCTTHEIGAALSARAEYTPAHVRENLQKLVPDLDAATVYAVVRLQEMAPKLSDTAERAARTRYIRGRLAQCLAAGDCNDMVERELIAAQLKLTLETRCMPGRDATLTKFSNYVEQNLPAGAALDSAEGLAALQKLFYESPVTEIQALVK